MRKKKVDYRDEFLCFDIETSKFKSDRIGQFYDTFVDGFGYSTTVYLWGVKNYFFSEMCEDINKGIGTYKPFRTFEELDEYFHSFDKEDKVTLCYIHNLPYEYSFLLPNLLNKYKLEEIFEIEGDTITPNCFLGDNPRKPFKLMVKCWPKIEFRCSFKMLNKSLQKVGESLGIDKHLYKSNYDNIYTSASKLPQEEFLYNESDLDITAKGIVKTFSSGNKYNATNTKMLAAIYSSTSFCKLNVREMMTYMGMREMSKDLRGNKPRDKYWYNTINMCYVGGYTHVNMLYTDKIVHNVYSMDLTSAYPSNMFVKKFPTYVHQGTYARYKKLNCEKGFFGVVVFRNITVRKDCPMTYIAQRWIVDYANMSLDNSKIVHADYLAVTINNIMLDIITQQYTFDSCQIADNLDDLPFLICTDFKYLKHSYIKSILYYAEQKTYWKKKSKEYADGSDEKDNAEYNLMKAKNQLNGMYGCHAMRPIRGYICYKDYAYQRGATDDEIEEVLERYRSSNIPYDLVVASYITTYTHKTLFDAIAKLTTYGGKVIYCDTDSIKFQYHSESEALELIKEINSEMQKEIVTDLQKEFIKLDNFYSFDYEGMYETFKSLGSKKYMFYKHGYFGITIAGVPKACSKIVNQRYQEGYYKDYSVDEIIDKTLTDGTVFTPREHIYNFWDVNLSCKLGCKYIPEGMYQNNEVITDANGEQVPVLDFFGCLLFDNEYKLSDSMRSADCYTFVETTNKSMEEDYNIYGDN